MQLLLAAVGEESLDMNGAHFQQEHFGRFKVEKVDACILASTYETFEDGLQSLFPSRRSGRHHSDVAVVLEEVQDGLALFP